MKFNIPGRVIEFMQGGEAYLAYQKGENSATSINLDQDEFELFQAIDAGKLIKPSKGGYYVRAELSQNALAALRYWAETLASSAADDASYEPEARLDLNAARKTLARLNKRNN